MHSRLTSYHLRSKVLRPHRHYCFVPAYEWVGEYTPWDDPFGKKKVGLIIHGLMGNGKSWVPTANRLQNQFINKQIQCLVVDLRHHNKSAVGRIIFCNSHQWLIFTKIFS